MPNGRWSIGGKAVSVSRDHKWIVCGAQRGASVWDAAKQEGVFEGEGRRVVAAIDICLATMFAESGFPRLATACEHDNQLLTIKTVIPSFYPACVVKRRGANYCHICRQQSQVFRLVD